MFLRIVTIITYSNRERVFCGFTHSLLFSDSFTISYFAKYFPFMLYVWTDVAILSTIKS